jgi:mannose-1-phosphate guanylyltransferase
MMWVLPSDHHVGDEATLAKAVADSLPIAEEGLSDNLWNTAHAPGNRVRLYPRCGYAE